MGEETAPVILVVDDDDDVRKFVGRVLERDGFQVVMRECPKKAILFIDIVDMVITDFSMPEMNGVMFSGIIKEKRPDLPVIIMTGDDLRTLPHHEADYTLQKPLTLGLIRQGLIAVGLLPNSTMSI